MALIVSMEDSIFSLEVSNYRILFSYFLFSLPILVSLFYAFAIKPKIKKRLKFIVVSILTTYLLCFACVIIFFIIQACFGNLNNVLLLVSLIFSLFVYPYKLKKKFENND